MKVRYQVLICMIAILIFCHGTGVCSTEGADAGSSAGNDFLNQINTADQLNERICQPMTSAATPMKTYGPADQQESFSAQLTAPSSESFLDIFVQPGPSGDIQTAIIKQDTNFDGTFDYAYTLPVIVSGVCANGFISCKQGTWDQCRYFFWRVTDALTVTIQEKPDIVGMAGCFCINSSCGSNLVWTNMDYVLTTFGSGVVAFIQERDPHVTITSVKSSLTYIKYYGQKSSDIGQSYDSTGVYFSGEAHPEIYFGGNFSGDDEKVRQMSSPDSPLSLIDNAFNSRMDPHESESCSIHRAIEFNDVGTPYVSLIENCSALATDICEVHEEKICDYNGQNCVLSYQNGAGTGLVPVSNIIDLKSSIGENWRFDTNGNAISYIRIDSSPVQTGNLEVGGSLWWNIKRTYLCETDKTLNVDPSSLKTNSIINSADISGSTMTYTEEGIQRSVEITLSDDIDTCEKSCQVLRPIENNAVSTSGGTWEYQANTATTEKVYKTCVNDQCPLEDGEIIEIDCACLNNFGEAAAVLQTMQEAGNDMICSEN